LKKQTTSHLTQTLYSSIRAHAKPYSPIGDKKRLNQTTLISAYYAG